MTYQTRPHILIVDDDEAICKTLSIILQAKGYQTTTATTAKEAIEKAKTQFFSLALLDIKLPDMEGTRLLAELQEIVPETIKIMVTGYPSLKNAVEALNYGASSYLMKPVDPEDLLRTIKNKLETQQQAGEMTKERLAEWIQSQVRKVSSSSFQDFLEETADILADFGLTKTQAKTYTALVALGIGSASEIAKTAKIRREEIYRIIPDLEKCGLVTRRLKAPRKFSAVKPDVAIEILNKKKLRTMKEEIDRLKHRQADLALKLKTIELPAKDDDPSVEVISQVDSASAKLTDMARNAKNQIDIIAPLQNLELVYLNRSSKLVKKIVQSIKMRIITGSCEADAVAKGRFLQTKGDAVELRQMNQLPFNLLIVDDKEAMWSRNGLVKDVPSIFWTNDPTQIAILKASFESMWQISQRKSVLPKKD